MALLRPGAAFREVAEKSWAMPQPYLAHRYMSLVHGAGLAARARARSARRGRGPARHQMMSR